MKIGAGGQRNRFIFAPGKQFVIFMLYYRGRKKRIRKKGWNKMNQHMIDNFFLYFVLVFIMKYKNSLHWMCHYSSVEYAKYKLVVRVNSFCNVELVKMLI